MITNILRLIESANPPFKIQNPTFNIVFNPPPLPPHDRHSPIARQAEAHYRLCLAPAVRSHGLETRAILLTCPPAWLHVKSKVKSKACAVIFLANHSNKGQHYD
jgi:hypothetical protein